MNITSDLGSIFNYTNLYPLATNGNNISILFILFYICLTFFILIIFLIIYLDY